MKNEELLKSISDMLKKHEDYLNENPDVFFGIKGRLLDAISYGEDLEKAEDEKKEKKTSRSGYRDWQPKKDYTSEQEAQIKQHMEDGWSHREAERFANASDAPKDFMSALEHRVHPSQPSDKMLSTMKEYALEYKQRAGKREGEQAEAGVNPQKYASHRDLKAHEEAYGDYNKEYKEFLGELDKKDLHPLDYDEAVSKWQTDWHAKNPEAKEKMVSSADAGKVFDEAKQARGEKLEEGAMNIITGGSSSGESISGEFSEAASGGGNIDTSLQTAAQMIGGVKGEGGYEAGTVKDPAAIFREQNPQFTAELKRKLAAKLGQNPEAQERHDAMPARDRIPKEQQPGKVKTLSQEEIQAQYGGRFNIKKPEGGQ